MNISGFIAACQPLAADDMGGSRKIRVDTVPAAQPMEYHGSLRDMILALWTGFVKRDVICCPVHGAERK